MRATWFGISGLAGLTFAVLTATVPDQVSAQSLSTQAAMHARIAEVYDFSPSKATPEIRKSKSAEMDSFWNEVKGHTDVELPLLRKELEDRSNPRFFFADGSSLLLSLSQSSADQKLAIDAFTQIDLSDFQSRSYLFEVHDLAVNGADVTPAALHILDDPKFQVYLPEHAYTLDQSACLLVALLPLPNDIWLSRAIDRLKTESNETATKSLLLLLFYAQTDESDRVIQQFATGSGSFSSTQDFAKSVLKHEGELGVGKQPSLPTEVKLREERRTRMTGVSDEAMDDMEELTKGIARARTLSR